MSVSILRSLWGKSSPGQTPNPRNHLYPSSALNLQFKWDISDAVIVEPSLCTGVKSSFLHIFPMSMAMCARVCFLLIQCLAEVLGSASLAQSLSVSEYNIVAIIVFSALISIWGSLKFSSHSDQIHHQWKLSFYLALIRY